MILHDFTGEVVAANSSLAQQCSSVVERRVGRQAALPELFLDPLTPLPLADAAQPSPAVRYVYLILASRPYAHETINRNVRALQRPGVLEPAALGTNESNLFLLHLDAKMSDDSAEALRSAVSSRPDVYFLRRRRHVMWAGWSMILSLLDVMSSLLERKLHFEYLITLGDADLTTRVHGEIESFFARFPGRSIMSIVQRKRDPRRYSTHESFRGFCWVRLSIYLYVLLDTGRLYLYICIGLHLDIWMSISIYVSFVCYICIKYVYTYIYLYLLYIYIHLSLNKYI